MDIGGLHIPTVVGTGVSATATFGFVYTLFSRFEKLQSRKNRHFVAHWLLGLKVPQDGSEHFFIELFDKLFGPRHWSFRCVAASSILTTVLVVLAFSLFRPFRFGNFFDPNKVICLASCRGYLDRYFRRLHFDQLDVFFGILHIRWSRQLLYVRKHHLS